MKLTIQLTCPYFTKLGRNTFERLGFKFKKNKMGYWVQEPKNQKVDIKVDEDLELVEKLLEYLHE